MKVRRNLVCSGGGVQVHVSLGMLMHGTDVRDQSRDLGRNVNKTNSNVGYGVQSDEEICYLRSVGRGLCIGNSSSRSFASRGDEEGKGTPMKEDHDC